MSSIFCLEFKIWLFRVEFSLKEDADFIFIGFVVIGGRVDFI